MKVIIAMLGTLLVAPAPARPTATMGMCLMHRPMLMAAQDPGQGNPGHREPPPGWICANGARAEHPCACHRECKQTPTENEDGTQGETTTVVEDAHCLAYCFKDHCTCGVSGCE